LPLLDISSDLFLEKFRF